MAGLIYCRPGLARRPGRARQVDILRYLLQNVAVEMIEKRIR